MGINYLSFGWERHILPRAAPTVVDIKQVGCLLPSYCDDCGGLAGGGDGWGDWGCTTKPQSPGGEECALGPVSETQAALGPVLGPGLAREAATASQREDRVGRVGVEPPASIQLPKGMHLESQ